MKPLDGQVAVVSGGAGDIGQAIALELARRGADIALGDIQAEARVATVLQAIRAMGRRARYDVVDVADADAVQEWVTRIQADFGVPTLLIPNAATVTVAPVLEMRSEQWSRELSVNLHGAFHLAQAGAQRLREAGKPGRIVFVGSWAAHAPHRNLPAYCVAKAGLRMLCRCMALELAPLGILVNEVAPGYVDAGLSKHIFDAEPGRREEAMRTVPIRALITSEEVARQVAYLCDPENRHSTGATLLMDGGLSLVTPGGGSDA